MQPAARAPGDPRGPRDAPSDPRGSRDTPSDPRGSRDAYLARISARRRPWALRPRFAVDDHWCGPRPPRTLLLSGVPPGTTRPGLLRRLGPDLEALLEDARVAPSGAVAQLVFARADDAARTMAAGALHALRPVADEDGAAFQRALEAALVRPERAASSASGEKASHDSMHARLPNLDSAHTDADGRRQDRHGAEGRSRHSSRESSYRPRRESRSPPARAERHSSLRSSRGTSPHRRDERSPHRRDERSPHRRDERSARGTSPHRRDERTSSRRSSRDSSPDGRERHNAIGRERESEAISKRLRDAPLALPSFLLPSVASLVEEVAASAPIAVDWEALPAFQRRHAAESSTDASLCVSPAVRRTVAATDAENSTRTHLHEDHSSTLPDGSMPQDDSTLQDGSAMPHEAGHGDEASRSAPSQRENRSGCARTEGVFRLGDAERAAAVSAAGPSLEVLAPAGEDLGEQSAKRRRRAVLAHAADADSSGGGAAGVRLAELALGRAQSALSTRARRVFLARSGIHAWGLFAAEDIEAGSLVLEYLGEAIRASLANARERRAEIAGRCAVLSSYLFRVDGHTVLDAAARGGLARFVNHSCEPSCVARSLASDGSQRIAMYARRDIARGEEITYDYKFPRETDPARRVRCLCGSRLCRGYLN